MNAKTTSVASEVLLGVGTFTWTATERRSDRYGCVYLIEDGHNSETEAPSPSLVDEAAARSVDGRTGKLIAKVRATRESTHIGDLYNKVFPRTPNVGDEIVLGEGTVFIQQCPDTGVMVGLKPADNREYQWLNLRALYDAHEQTVELVLRLTN